MYSSECETVLEKALLTRNFAPIQMVYHNDETEESFGSYGSYEAYPVGRESSCNRKSLYGGRISNAPFGITCHPNYQTECGVSKVRDLACKVTKNGARILEIKIKIKILTKFLGKEKREYEGVSYKQSICQKNQTQGREMELVFLQKELKKLLDENQVFERIITEFHSKNYKLNHGMGVASTQSTSESITIEPIVNPEKPSSSSNCFSRMLKSCFFCCFKKKFKDEDEIIPADTFSYKINSRDLTKT